MTDQFATEIDLPAPAEEVFRHLTDPAAMIRWMGQHAVLKPVPGGAFEVDINGVPVRGHYLEVDPPRRVLVSWGVAGNTSMPPGATEVEFTLTPHPGRHPAAPSPPQPAARPGTTPRHRMAALPPSAGQCRRRPRPRSRSLAAATRSQTVSKPHAAGPVLDETGI